MAIAIDISDHPSMTGIKRKAVYESFSISDKHKILIIGITVQHFNQQMEHVSGAIPDKTVQLIARNNTRVDANGDPVRRFVMDDQGELVRNPDGTRKINPDWESATPHWDYFDQMLKTGPINIYTMIRDIMIRRRTQGYFDNIY